MTGKTYCFNTIDHNSRVEDTDVLALSGQDIVIASSEWTGGGHDENNGEMLTLGNP